MKKTIFAVLLMAVYAQGTIRYCAYNGNDENDGTSRALAVLTLQKGLDVSVGVDSLLVCYDTILSTQTDMVGIKRGGTAPATLTAPFRVIGCDTAGNVRASGYTTIRASASLADGLVWFADSADFTYLQGFDFDGNNSAAFCARTENSVNVYGCKIDNCKVHDAINNGLLFRVGTSGKMVFTIKNTEIYSNGADGCGWIAENLSGINYLGCYIHDNVGNGAVSSAVGSTIYNCIFARNGKAGLKIDATASVKNIIGNLFFDNDSSGINLYSSPTFCQLKNNIFLANGQVDGHAINFNGADLSNVNEIEFNCSWGNANHTSMTPDTLPGIGNVYADPLITDTTAGQENFSLQSASPCKNTGFQNLFLGGN